LHQRVLEGVFRIGWGPTPEDQLGIHKLDESIVDPRLRHLRDRAD
jgi:hypothetical protein